MFEEKRQEYREIIIDHFSNPIHKKEIDLKICENCARQKSKVCADDISVQLIIKNNIIENVYFDGSGCAYSIAAADILLDNIIDLNLNEAYIYLNNYYQMCSGNEYNEVNDETIIFSSVRKEINRINCVLLGFQAIMSIIEKVKK